MEKDKITAVVLAAGSGTRMGGETRKQYMLLNGKPVLSYCLKIFQESSIIDEIVLVANEPDFCREQILEKYHMDKVKQIVPGGRKRCHSVYAGLLAAKGSDYVLIHDGARPFVTQEMIEASAAAAKQYGACAVGVPAKDTIKLADGEGFVAQTPDRSKLWQIQTPQAFSYDLICNAYRDVLKRQPDAVTDDAGIIEYGNYAKVKLVMGSYANIKITTPEDMAIASVMAEST